MESEFLNQFAGSSSANVVTLLVLAMIYICKRKCEHSKCKIHNACIDVELSTSDSHSDKNGEDLQAKIEIILQKMHRGNNQSVPVQRAEGVSLV